MAVSLYAQVCEVCRYVSGQLQFIMTHSSIDVWLIVYHHYLRYRVQRAEDLWILAVGASIEQAICERGQTNEGMLAMHII